MTKQRSLQCTTRYLATMRRDREHDLPNFGERLPAGLGRVPMRMAL